ncbi:glycosyltransferase family 2 protein, partial [Legionella londiniensis]
DDAAQSRFWLRKVRHERNFGRGRAVRTGFKAAKGNYIICMDADLSYGPEHIPKLLFPLINNEADITLASPYHKDGLVKNVPKQRAVLSKWGNRLLAKGIGGQISTVTCVVRGFKREIVNQLELVNDGKELHLEIIQKAQMMGFRIMEIPASLIWKDKKRGRSKNKGFLPDIAVFKMRRTILSHLIFNYITNPGLLLFIPMFILIMNIIIGLGIMGYFYFENLHQLHLSYFQTLRQTLLNGQLTFIVMLFSFIALMIFSVFYFLSFQLKHYFEELYTLQIRLNEKITHFLEINNQEIK